MGVVVRSYSSIREKVAKEQYRCKERITRLLNSGAETVENDEVWRFAMKREAGGIKTSF